MFVVPTIFLSSDPDKENVILSFLTYSKEIFRYR